MLASLAATTFLLTLFWQTRFSLCCLYQHIDYAIPFIYLSDLLLGAWFLLALVSKSDRVSFWAFVKDQRMILWPMLLFGCWSLLSLSLSADVTVAALYRWVKMAEVFGLMLFLSWWISSGRIAPFRVLRLMAWGLWPLCLLALAEVVKQESLGIQFIGEWKFSAQTPGIATFFWQGKRWLRPYATFPHPNVLGGILSVLTPLLFWSRDLLKKREFALLWSVLVLALLATFSRTGWVTFLLLMVIAVFVKGKDLKRDISNREMALWGVVFLGLLILFLVPNPIVGRFLSLLTVDRQSFLRRRELARLAWQLIREHSLLGVGMNQFPFMVEKMGRILGPVLWTQPVHNLWLLVAAESGMMGLFFLLWFVFLLGRGVRDYLRDPKNRESKYLLLILLGLLMTSMVDHYWWTLQPGILFLGISLGICWSQTMIPPPSTSSLR